MASIAVALIETVVEEVIESGIEEAVIDSVEELVQEGVVTIVDEAVEANLEEDVEESVTDSVEESVVEDIQKSLWDLLKKSFKDNFSDVTMKLIKFALDETSRKTTAETTKVLQSDASKLFKGLNQEALEKLQRLQLSLSHNERDAHVTPDECCRFLDELDKLAGDLAVEVDICIYLVTQVENEVEYFTDFVCLKREDVEALKASPVFGPVVKTILSNFHFYFTEENVIPGNIKKGLALKSRVVPLSLREVYNVDRFGPDNRTMMSWVKWWRDMVHTASKTNCKKNYCRIAKPGEPTRNMTGGIVELKTDNLTNNDWYMLPMCTTHDEKIYNRSGTGGPMTVGENTWALKWAPIAVGIITPFSPLVGVTSATDKETAPSFEQRIVTEFTSKVLKKTLPKQVNGLVEAINAAVKKAGEDTKKFTKDEGNHITRISLIPFYGWVRGPMMVSHMKTKCLDHLSTVKNQKVGAAAHGYTIDSAAIQAEAQEIVNGADWKAFLEDATVKEEAANKGIFISYDLTLRTGDRIVIKCDNGQYWRRDHNPNPTPNSDHNDAILPHESVYKESYFTVERADTNTDRIYLKADNGHYLKICHPLNNNNHFTENNIWPRQLDGSWIGVTAGKDECGRFHIESVDGHGTYVRIMLNGDNSTEYIKRYLRERNVMVGTADRNDATCVMQVERE